MKPVKLLALCLALLFCLPILLGSCTPKKTLKVVSRDYPKLTELTAGEVDWERYSSVIPNDPYLYFNCFVSVKDGKLCISNKAYDKVSYYMGTNGYFLAMNMHMDKWVRYFPYSSGDPHCTSEPAVLFDLHETFRGFVEVDHENAYIVTNFLDTTGEVEDWRYQVRIWRLHCDSQNMNGHDGWSWEVAATIPDDDDGYAIAQCYSEEEKALFLMTTVGAFRYSETDGSLTKIGESKLFGEEGLYFPSAVYLNGEMICGNAYGVYTYHLTTGEEWWFPMDYDKIVK